MNIKFLSTGKAPEYIISGETVNGIDLSPLEYGGEFVADKDTRQAGLRYAERDEHGVLWVTLQQEVGPGHWTAGEWIDAANYDPTAVYVVKLDKPYAGKPWVKLGNGEFHYV